MSDEMVQEDVRIRDDALRSLGSPPSGRVIDGRYDLRRLLGSAGGAEEYEAVHRYTNRSVVLRIVSAHSAGFEAVGSRPPSDTAERLARELRVLSSIRHPSMVEILDGGITAAGEPFVARELLRGRTLEGLLAARGKLSVQDSIGVSLQLVDLLEAAHAGGVMHRQLSPASLFLINDEGRERLKVLDFAMERFHSLTEWSERDRPYAASAQDYAAPEVLKSPSTVDSRADVYSVGTILYECLSGGLPPSSSPATPHPATRSLSRRMAERVVSLRRGHPEMGEALAEVIARSTSVERDDRYASMNEFRLAVGRAVPHASARTWLLAPSALRESAGTSERSGPVSSRQRRRSVRVPYCTPVQVLLGSGGSVEGTNEDISEGGLLVLSTASWKQGQRVRIKFALPVDGSVTECTANVRWVGAHRRGASRGRSAVGFEFASLPTVAADVIARFVAQVE